MGARKTRQPVPSPDERWKTMYTNELNCILQIAERRHRKNIISDLKRGKPSQQWGAIAELVCLRCFLIAGCSLIQYEYKGRGIKKGRSVDFLFSDLDGHEFLVEVKVTTGKDTIKNVKNAIEKKTGSKLDNGKDISIPFIIFLWSLNYLGDSRIDDPSKKTELFYTGNTHNLTDPLFGGNSNREISGVIYSEIDHNIWQATNVDKVTLYQNVNPFNAPDLSLRGYPWMTAYNENRIELENKLQNAVIRISFNEKIEYNGRHQERTRP